MNWRKQNNITLADTVRESSGRAISDLKAMNIRSFLLTGDNEKIASSVAGRLGMDGYLANILPHEKQQKEKEFPDKGGIVAMTGDGVNDAPALAQADAGITVGSGTDVAAIPLAAVALYPGFVLSPAAGAVLMSASTIIVAFNAQLLRMCFK